MLLVLPHCVYHILSTGVPKINCVNLYGRTVVSVNPVAALAGFLAEIPNTLGRSRGTFFCGDILIWGKEGLYGSNVVFV